MRKRDWQKIQAGQYPKGEIQRWWREHQNDPAPRCTSAESSIPAFGGFNPILSSEKWNFRKNS